MSANSKTIFTVLVIISLILLQKTAAGQKSLYKTIDQLFTKYTDSGFSGTVLLVHKNKALLTKGYGYASVEENKLNTPATLFNVASIGKHFTAYSILLLEKRGLLNVNDHINKYVGAFNDIRDSITIHHLLLHSSGLFKAGTQLNYSGRELFIKSVKDSGYESIPGASYRYSNAGYTMLAAIVEIVSKKPFEIFLHENVFKPAGMESTGFPWEQRLQLKHFATGYDENKKPVRREQDEWGARGPGNLVTTIGDLHKWIIAIQNRKFLPFDMRSKMFYDFIPGRETYSWNKSRTSRHTSFYHKGGGRDDFESQIMWYPDDEVIIIFLINNNYNLRRILFSRIREIMN